MNSVKFQVESVLTGIEFYKLSYTYPYLKSSVSSSFYHTAFIFFQPQMGNIIAALAHIQGFWVDLYD